MRKTLAGIVGIIAVAAAVGCSQQSPNAPATILDVASATSPSLAASAGGTVKEALTGPAIGGVVPEGQALADESHYLSGGSTILTVQIKNVNLPDGTIVGVSLDFKPIGSITLSHREGTMRADLGHFAVSRDKIIVSKDTATILSGGFFQ
jgi:hypothetical protein